MINILTAEEMREADSRTSGEMHVGSAVLMERAALICAAEAESLLNEAESHAAKPGSAGCLVVSGPGNNGGDGIAAGRILLERGYRVDFALIGRREKCSALTKEQLLSVEALESGITFNETVPDLSLIHI